jgi:hypothetical protein
VVHGGAYVFTDVHNCAQGLVYVFTDVHNCAQGGGMCSMMCICAHGCA